MKELARALGYCRACLLGVRGATGVPRGYWIDPRQPSFGYDPGMRGLLLAGLIAASALVQSGRLAFSLVPTMWALRR